MCESETAIPMPLVSAVTCVRIPWASVLSHLVGCLHANGSTEIESKKERKSFTLNLCENTFVH